MFKGTIIKRWLDHRLTKELDIDVPDTTIIRRRIIREKIFLRKIYEEWYKFLVDSLPAGNGAVLELGTGGGFLQDFLPDVITSERFFLPGIDIVLDGSHLPFAGESLKGIVMTDVFHHLPNSRDFLREAVRCLTPGGVVVMVEPWVTPWSQWVYRNFHHEIFLPGALNWEFTSEGPLSGANTALPWIVFERDRPQFMQEFSQFRIHSIEPCMPFSYLLSGGVSFASLQPGWVYGAWRIVEHLLKPWMNKLAMFAQIILRRVDENEG